MSCGLALAAALAFADPAAGQAVAAASVPASIAAEPMYADIVRRSRGLKAIVDGWIAAGAAGDEHLVHGPDFVRFKAEALALSEADMKGHLDLAARNTDGDLKCILRGLSQDLPEKVAQLESAADAAARGAALSELAYLLDDNAAVILAPPAPAA